MNDTESYQPQPGDRCMFVKDVTGKVVAVEHVEPCRDHYATGTITDIRTGKVISR